VTMPVIVRLLPLVGGEPRYRILRKVGGTLECPLAGSRKLHGEGIATGRKRVSPGCAETRSGAVGVHGTRPERRAQAPGGFGPAVLEAGHTRTSHRPHDAIAEIPAARSGKDRIDLKTPAPLVSLLLFVPH
jgi:hypothetical protein